METDFISAEKENVLIQAGACSITVVPQFGGKIASIRIDGRELLHPRIRHGDHAHVRIDRAERVVLGRDLRARQGVEQS